MTILTRSNFQAHPFHLVSPSPLSLKTKSVIFLNSKSVLTLHSRKFHASEPRKEAVTTVVVANGIICNYVPWHLGTMYFYATLYVCYHISQILGLNLQEITEDMASQLHSDITQNITDMTHYTTNIIPAIQQGPAVYSYLGASYLMNVAPTAAVIMEPYLNLINERLSATNPNLSEETRELLINAINHWIHNLRVQSVPVWDYTDELMVPFTLSVYHHARSNR